MPQKLKWILGRFGWVKAKVYNETKRRYKAWLILNKTNEQDHISKFINDTIK